MNPSQLIITGNPIPRAEAERYKNEYQSLKGYIDQLKQQLEETEELNKKLAEHSQSVDKALDDSCDVIRNLKQQLAEKDQAIEGLQEINQSLGQTCNNDAKEIERLREQLHTANQETLHFQNKYFAEKQIAIEELEKVKKSLKHKGFVLKVKPPITMPTTPMNEYLKEFMIFEDAFDRIFDQQIKSLKGEE